MSSLLEKDAGFCSGSSEHEEDDHHHSHENLHSPTDASEDSVEVKFTPISKNKRKSSEPSRVIPDPDQGPLKKRFRYEPKIEVESNCFRPWAPSSSIEVKPNPADLLIRHPAVTTLHRAIASTQLEQEQPLALIAKKPLTTVISSQKVNYEASIESLIQKTEISRISQVSIPLLKTPAPAKSTTPKPSSQRNYKNMTRERRIEAKCA